MTTLTAGDGATAGLPSFALDVPNRVDGALGTATFDQILSEHDRTPSAAEVPLAWHAKNASVAYGDVPPAFADRVNSQTAPRVALDIETDPCAFDEDRYWERTAIRVVTVHDLSTGETVAVQLAAGESPDGLVFMLENPSLTVYLHHAMFDLRFIRYHLGVTPENVVCTKVLAKAVGTPCKQSLVVLLEEYLGVRLPKGLALSDWSSPLTREQLTYCVGDVAYLGELADALRTSAADPAAVVLAERAFAAVPHRVELEVVGGMADLFGY